MVVAVVSLGWMINGGRGSGDADLDRLWGLRESLGAEIMLSGIQLSAWIADLWDEHAAQGVNFRA